jgi:hypothetical protein
MYRFLDIVENNTEWVFVDPVCVDSARKMSLTFLLKTCLYGCVLQGVKKDGSVSGSVVFAKPSAS